MWDLNPRTPAERVGTSPTSPETRCEPSAGVNVLYHPVLEWMRYGFLRELGRGCISAWCGPKNTERHPN